jgi:predicted anti-sigma-YlaC factor YlaD
MFDLKATLILGLILRPLQIIVMLYLINTQLKELRVRSIYQSVKRTLLWVFIVNILLYAFSLFVDMVGLFHWFASSGIYVLTIYLLVNVLSATFVTIALLLLYRVRIRNGD